MAAAGASVAKTGQPARIIAPVVLIRNRAALQPQPARQENVLKDALEKEGPTRLSRADWPPRPEIDIEETNDAENLRRRPICRRLDCGSARVGRRQDRRRD